MGAECVVEIVFSPHEHQEKTILSLGDIRPYANEPCEILVWVRITDVEHEWAIGEWWRVRCCSILLR